MARKGKKKKPLSQQTLAIQNGYKSGFEFKTAIFLKERKIPFEYEVRKIAYTVPKIHKHYTPDFFLPNGIIVETKGRFTMEDRKKHILIKNQHPDIDIRFVFQNANGKIRKGSPTTYAKWCDQNNIKWAHGTIPDSWMEE
jgi:hypothetical protein